MAALQLEVQGVAGITSEVETNRKGGVMRITRAGIQNRMEFYEKEYGFHCRDGWNQIRKDLTPAPEGSTKLPRAVAYGAYMALKNLLES